MVDRPKPRHMVRNVALGVALLGCAGVIGLYAVRKPLARNWIDAELKKRGVAGHYDLTQLDPNHQRLEHVVIGDPAHPELTADWLETETSVGLFGATLDGVKAGGVRVRSLLDKDGSLHFGALEKFRTGGAGAFKLPNMRLDLADARLALATPYGNVNARLDGTGNLAHDFAGKLGVTTGAIVAGGCVIAPLGALLTVTIHDAKPHFTGPVTSDALTCGATRLANPVLTPDATLASDFSSAHGTLAVISDQIVSPLIAQVAQTLGVTKDTPLAPFGAQFAHNIAAIGSGVRATAQFSADARTGLILTAPAAQSRSGVRVTSGEFTTVTLDQKGLHAVSNDLNIEGLGFPGSRFALAGTPSAFKGTATFAPLTAPNTRLALAPIAFSHDSHGTRINTAATFDGPVTGGTVHGLTLPIAGLIGTAGGFALANPCVPVKLDRLQLSSLTLGKTATNVCVKGQDVALKAPRLAGSYASESFDVAAAALHYGVTSKTLVLDQISWHYGAARVQAARAQYSLASQIFSAAAIAATTGAPGHDSKLAVDGISGSVKGNAATGIYTNASGALPNVPLALDHSSGTWGFAKAALSLKGNLNIADTDPAKRFEPMVSPDVELHLAKGVITASGTLREPKSGAFVSRVSITHTLSSGTGGADINILEMPLLTFGKALQPQALTRITLGVVANLKGSVSGQGRIRWNPKGVTSEGDFETEHMDLAAVFGPVSGIKGKVHFTDLLGMTTAPHQVLEVASVNPGVAVEDGVIRYQLLPGNRVAIEGGAFPFANGQLVLEPTVMDLSESATRRLTFTVNGVDAAKFIAQSGFEDVAATGIFDGTLPLIFDSKGGRIEGGALAVRQAGGVVSYVGPVSNATLGRFGMLAFDALKSMRYHGLKIELNGPLDGEMVTLVKLSGTNESPKAAKKSYLLKQITGIPFKFNIRISAPFRTLFKTAKDFQDPSDLVQQDLPANLKASAAPAPKPAPKSPIHPPATSIQP